LLLVGSWNSLVLKGSIRAGNGECELEREFWDGQKENRRGTKVTSLMDAALERTA